LNHGSLRRASCEKKPLIAIEDALMPEIKNDKMNFSSGRPAGLCLCQMSCAEIHRVLGVR
jgi:hypothetical protein